MKQYLLLLSLAFAGLGAKGQNGFQERAYRLDSRIKLMSASDQDRQGNVIMSGLIYTGTSSGNGDIYKTKVMLFTPNTDTLWSRTGPDVPDYRYNPFVKFRTVGGFSLTTTVKKSLLYPPPPDDYDVILQKISSSGNLLMNATFNPSLDNNGIISFLTMPDNGYLINEWEKSGNAPYVISLTRTDSTGSVLWQRNHTKVAANGLAYMEHAGNGKTIMAGSIYSGGSGLPPFRIKLFLVDANGDSLRANTLSLTGNSMRDELMLGGGTENSIISLSDGGFLLTGLVDTIGTNFVKSLGLIVRLNASLQPVWRHVQPLPASGGNSVFFSKAKELKDGSIIVLGQDNGAVLSNNTAVNNFQLYRFNAFGALLNTYSFTSSLYPSLRLNTLEALPDSSFMIGGNCRTAGNAQTGFYVAKVKIPGLAAGRPSYIMAAPKEVTVAANALGAAYPNPASGQVYIPYQFPNGTRTASVRLTDLTGKEVGSYEIKAEKQGALPVNVSRLAAGLYLYTLVLDGRPVATKKLSVQK